MQDHPSYATTLTHYLAALTVLGAACVTLFFFVIIITYKSYKGTIHKWFQCLSDYIFPIGFFVTLGGVFLTLFYEYVLHYVPCDLCWYQRVFLYPQVFMFAYAWYKKDRAVLPYALILSLAGGAVALYHHLLQIGYDIMKPCSTAPFAVDCSTPSFIEYGFVTFPFMAVVLFGFMTTLAVSAIRFK